MTSTHHFKPMSKFNQTVLATVSSIALLGGALTLITPVGSQTFQNSVDSNRSHLSDGCSHIDDQSFCN
jgi:hypothetical protein